MKSRPAFLALLAGLLFASPVLGGFGGTNLVGDGLDNTLNMFNWELVLRAGSGHGVGDVTLPGGPYSIIDPTAAPTIDNDIIVQILRANSFLHLGPPFASGDPVGGGGELTVYLVGKVLTGGAAGPAGDSFIPLVGGDTPDIDPFGIITPDGMLMAQWYVDSDSDMLQSINYASAGETQADALTRAVGKATDGSRFADFGIGAAFDSSGYGAGAFKGGVEVTGLIGTPVTEFEVTGALNVLNPQSLGAGFFFVDTGEITVAPATTGDTSIEFTQRVKKETTYSGGTGTTGQTPWYLFSSDPVHIAGTPEPGALVAYAGLLVAGLCCLVIRRFRGARQR